MLRNILIVEDDVAFSSMLKSWFKRNGYTSTTCMSVNSAKIELKTNKFDLVLSDLRLPDNDGIMLLDWIKEQRIEVPVIIMTSYAEIKTAVNAIKLGAEDFLEKPINPTILKEKIEQAINRTDSINKKAADKSEFSLLNSNNTKIVLGKSAAAKLMQEYISMVAPTKMSVLILGESGTGKEYAARMLHMNSDRKDKPFIAVDCGSLSKELASSELFGHLKGSFTSAIDNKKGVFEQAKGGTLFLDEIGNLSYDVQVQLLRSLQEKKIRPVGSATDIDVDVRIISATNENLEQAMLGGKFREDLYHRLNEFSIIVPPLREQVRDIEMFANHFLTQANEELNKNVIGFEPKVIEIFNNYHWSGNLRELRNIVRRATLFSNSDTINENNLPNLSPKGHLYEDMALKPGDEKQQIENAIKIAHGNKSLAAEILKISRKTLYNKMK